MKEASHSVFIGLGSNLDQPANQLKQALKLLAQLPDTELLSHSSFYGSKPVGPQDQPDFINAVAQLNTTLSPEILLQQLQAIEQQQGRIKKRHWGERTIDLDILLFGQTEIDTPNLTIPHKEISQRDFVLKPLLELEPQLSLPNGTRLSSLLPLCPDNQLHLYSETP